MASKSGMSWELFRKTVHLSGLLIVVGYTLMLNYVPERLAILALTVLLVVLLEIEHVRLEHKPRIMSLLDGAFRKHEKDSVSGAVFMVISCIICFAAYDYWVAFLALFMTVFGDMAAAIFGRAFGRVHFKNGKTIIGTLSGLSANLIVGILILPAFLPLVIVMSITATFVEFVTNKLDDNLTVPIFAGMVGQALVYFTSIDLPAIDFTFLGLF